MANVDVAFPVIERYQIVVSAPMRQGVVVVKGWTTEHAEESLTKRRNHLGDRDPEQKIELDRVIAMLKCAKSYGGQLEDIHNANNKICIVLSFYSLRDMVDFQAEMLHQANTAGVG